MFTFYVLAAWSPFCRWVPASEIRNPQTRSEQQAEQQRKLQIQMSLPPIKKSQWKAISPIPLIPPSWVTREGRGTQIMVINNTGHTNCPVKQGTFWESQRPLKTRTKPNLPRCTGWGLPVCFLTLEDAAKQTKGHKTFGRLRKQSSSGRTFFLAWWRVEATGIPPS